MFAWIVHSTNQTRVKITPPLKFILKTAKLFKNFPFKVLRSTVRRIQFKINPKHTLSHVFNYTQYCLKVKLVVNQSSWLDKISNPYTALHQLHKKAFDPWRSQFNVHAVYFLETCFLTKPSKGIMLKNQHIWFSKWSFLPHYCYL